MNSSPERTVDQQDNEIDLLELWDVLWAGRQVIVAATFLFAVFSIFYSLTRTEIYRAEALLAPAQNRESGSPLAGQLGGAAALVGIDLGSSGIYQVNSVLATLRSREFILKFVNDHGLQDQLFPGQTEGSEGPTDWQIYRKFSGIFNVTRDASTELVRLSIQWTDPVQGAEWTNLIVSAINAHEKARDVEEATSAIEYLQAQLSTTQLVEMQRVFYQLIESQTRVVMLADVRDEYVFRVIDPAVVPDQRISPKRRVMVIIGTIIGLAGSMIFVVFRHLISERWIFTRNYLSARKSG